MDMRLLTTSSVRSQFMGSVYIAKPCSHSPSSFSRSQSLLHTLEGVVHERG